MACYSHTFTAIGRQKAAAYRQSQRQAVALLALILTYR